MQFRDLKKQYQILKKDMDAAMLGVAASSAYIMGQPVKELEAQLAAYVGTRHCLTCGNGTDALTIALKTWGIGPGDCVFVPDFTFFASAEVISLEGAVPVFVDVDPGTFNMDAADLEKKIIRIEAERKYTPKAIITVDLFGLPADYPVIRRIADRHGLKILEDGAQGFGGEIEGKKSCSFGDIATTSFFPAKPLGCYGDGGALFTDNEEWAVLINSYRVHGKGSFKYDNVRIGMNSRLDTLQAAILQVKFKAFQEYELQDINRAAALYSRLLEGKVTTPHVPQGFYSSWAQYSILLKDREQRDRVQSALKEKGIPSMVYYPKAMSEQTAYKSIGAVAGACPQARELCQRVLALPIHPYITAAEIETVVQEITAAL